MIETSNRTNSPPKLPMPHKLPQIEHPVLRIAKENAENFNNTSDLFSSDESGRPVSFEDVTKYKSVRSKSHNSLRSSSQLDDITQGGIFLTNIPENVAVKEGLTNSTKLPIFGNRSSLQSRSSNSSRCSSLSSSIVKGASSEEISQKFLSKLNSSYYEVRKKFIDNDPDQKGNVTRDGLMRVMQLVTGCYVTKQTLSAILTTWGLKPDKQIFSFGEINSISMNKYKPNGSNFVDPVARQKSKPLQLIQLKSGKVAKILKEKLSSRDIYLTDMFPDAVNFQEFVLKPDQLKSSLNKMMIDLSPDEMNKLWHRFDPQKKGFISGLNFLKNLGIVKPQFSNSPRYVAQLETKNPLNIPNSFENLLKIKLREGYKTLGEEFAKKDTNGTGYLSPDNFIATLADYNLVIEKDQLNEFLTRCNVTATKDGIHYPELLTKFQDRSEAGITHRVLMNDKMKQTNSTNLDPLALIQMKLINLFQKDFLELLNSFRKYDKNQTGSITLNDFKKVMETKLGTNFTDEQFRIILDNLPLNQDLKVPYLDFLKQFDTGNFTPVFNTTNSKSMNYDNEYDDKELKVTEDPTSQKSVVEIKKIIKDIFLNRFSELEAAFEDVDILNTNQLTVEMMYQVFKRLNLNPELTRGDIRSIWKTFILRDKHTLDYKEFVRHFIYNKTTSCYPNSKLFPPIKGDSDFSKRSRKLNGATDIILDGLRSKIEIMYQDLQNEFNLMDAEKSGLIDLEKFKEVMRELSIHLSYVELDLICEKCIKPGDKIDYIAFLRPYAKYPDPTHQKQSKKKNRQEKSGETSLFKKLKILNETSVKRAIKKADYNNSGLLSIDDLRAIILLEGVALNNDENFELMNSYDTNLTGNINYIKLMDDVKC